MQHYMMNNGSNPNKKRKANNGHATTDGAHDDVNIGNTNDGGSFLSSWFGYYFAGRRSTGSSSWQSQEDNNPSQLDRMENIMMRMEEKLANVSSTVSSLERRCEQFEAKCSSLETKLETTSQSMKVHVDRSLEYHEMRILNQQWKYSAPIYSILELMDANYDDDEADYIVETSMKLKKCTEAMRRGEFPEEDNTWENEKGVSLYTDDDHLSFNEDTHIRLSPHWREFAAALKQFKPAFDMLPDNCETCITFCHFTLNREMTELIQEALVDMPFKKLSLQSTYRIHGGINTIASIMTNNKYLQKLDIHEIEDMDGNDIAELCSAIHRHPSITDVSMDYCFSDGLGNEMLRTLLRTDNLKLERLDMSYNNISSVETLPDFLATNPILKELNLSGNKLDDNDAALIANALGSNTKLRHLLIDDNRVDEDGEEALRVAVRNESSLNAVADSNHSCAIESDYLDNENKSDSREINRARKIHALLSSRNETLSNVHHFGDIDAKLLPNVIVAVQKYSRLTGKKDCVNTLSIVNEVMRRWDKVSPLYKS